MAQVLVIDDDEAIRLAMRAALEELGGYSVIEAVDGRAGLEMLRASADRLVVLLDLLMPGLDGLAVLRAADADEQLATRHAYVLVTVSRRATEPALTAGLHLPVTIISKPFDIGEILDAVAKAMQRFSCEPAAEH